MSTCADHTPAPNTYLGWHEWAEKKYRTHEQVRCDECGHWRIWVERPKSAPSQPERISDEQIEYWAGPLCAGFFPEHKLAREVQDSRRILAAIRALPDDPPPDRHLNTTTPTFGYRYAMRQVKALLDGES